MRNARVHHYVLQLTSCNEREGSASVNDTSGGGENGGRRTIANVLVYAPELRGGGSARDGATQSI